MTFFRLLYKVRPTTGAPNSNDLAGGEMQFLIVADNIEKADLKARSYIMDYSWTVEARVYAEAWPDGLSFDPEQAPLEARLYEKAKSQGFAVLFLSWPKTERPGIVEHRPLGDPLTPKGKH